ncbi:unnamed protein product [Anisakis simplex]|uniref:UCH domain-containing protein n=1 Tax=Anisakis simplex TaxID=6269 RepID=A0A0M3KH72_ANISI|nr:unnamed protein product [Anisakis simplex]
MQRIVRKAVATTRGSADTLGSIADMFMKRKACSDCNRETHAERVSALNKIFSERERDDQGRVLFKLPLSLLENVINIEYKTQAKMGQTAEMELIGHSAGEHPSLKNPSHCGISEFSIISFSRCSNEYCAA